MHKHDAPTTFENVKTIAKTTIRKTVKLAVYCTIAYYGGQAVGHALNNRKK